MSVETCFYRPRKATDYSVSEFSFLWKMGETMTVGEMRPYLNNRSEGSLYNFLQRHGIPFKKAPHFVPNKGRKGYMPPGLIPFKAGHHSHNARPEGSVRDWPDRATGRVYSRIKVGGKWVWAHRHAWEAAHGKVPAGHVLRCRTDDTRNPDPANWELMSRREFTTRNNSTPGRSERMSETMKDRWMVVKKLEATGRTSNVIGFSTAKASACMRATRHTQLNQQRP